ncbi:BamA/OMP85 family outer membrane protein [Blattabacterium cuenoti]|uniref:BamA/OMP85 family outer membrane protein n=1 Tax=Blattabacterium cuenoti TaxID=1653831 RepID=UPI00163C0D41|nr:POTRA domain-containing protein [Blattabacterium cuenoti]
MEKLDNKNLFLFSLIFFLLHIPYSKTENRMDNLMRFDQENHESFSKIRIRNIYVMGKTKYNSSFVSNLSHLFPGEEISILENKVDQAIIKLWKSNLFGKISIYKKNISKNEIDLFFDLEDLIEIHKINVEGIGNMQFPTIQKIHPGDKITEHLIQNIKNDIKNYYVKQGYPEVSIKSRLIIKNKKNILNIYVKKGKRIGIGNILFDGNQSLSTKNLLNLMEKTRKKIHIPIIEKSSYFVYENIKDDLKNIRSKYQSMGFIDVQVILDSIWKNETEDYEVKIKIIEGKKYYLGDINFIGNNIVQTDLLRKILSYKRGDIYNKNGINNNILNTNISSIISHYLDLGYLFVKIVPVEKRIEDDKIHLEIKIEENQPVYINKVHISGNTITKDHVIRRELNIYPGDLFSSKKIKSSLFRLINLNFFEKNKIYPYIQKNNDKTIDLEWRVTEKSANQIQLYGGYGKDKLLGNLQLNFGNFSLSDLFQLKSWNPIPQGDGQKLILSCQFGKYFQSYGFSFIEPWIEKDKPTALALNIKYSKKKVNNEDIYFLPFLNEISEKIPHDGFLERIGTSVKLDKLLTFLDPYTKIELSMNYDKFFYEKNLFKLNNLSYLISLQRFSGEPDFVFPLRGSNIQLNSIFTLPHSILFKKSRSEWIEFFKFKINSFWYKKIIEKMIMKIGGEFGILGKYPTKNLFSFQKFYMGGIKNTTDFKLLENIDYIPLRGYSSHINDSDYITPKNGGVIYNKLVLEIRYLVKDFSNLSKLWTNFFIEGGNISDSYQEFHPLKIKKSFGFGFRFFCLPIGLIGIDLGYPIDGGRGIQSKWKTHFIIGKDL